MAASKAQKIEAASLLASGQTEAEVAAMIGVSRSTIQGWKRKESFQELMRSAQKTVAEVSLINHGNKILREVEAIKEREPAIREQVWGLLDGMFAITQQVVDRARSEEVSVRSLPALTDSVCKLVTAYTTLDDRIGALEIVGNAVLKMGSETDPATKAR